MRMVRPFVLLHDSGRGTLRWTGGVLMRRILISAAAALALLVAGGERSPQASAASAASDAPSLDALVDADCIDDSAMQVAQAAGRLPQEGGVASDEWPPD